MKDLSRLSMRSVTSLLRGGGLTPLSLLEHHFTQISALNNSVNALCFVNAAGAKSDLKQREAEGRSGKFGERLHCIPFSAKDSVHIAGLPYSDGSRGSFIESSSATNHLVKVLLREGAVCIGKANMAERGKSYYTENPLYGRTNNPFNLEHSPGGSGGGDAACVACDFAQFALGADSGGSIRVPASYCGLFGLYPSRGLLSEAGTGQYAHTVGALFRNPGVIAKDLDDLELLFRILSAYDENDQHSCEMPWQLKHQSTLRSGRIAYFSEINGVRCSAEIEAAMLDVVKRFEEAGFSTLRHCPPACAGAYEIFIVLAGQSSLFLDDLLAAANGNPIDLASEGPIIANLRHRIATELPPLTVEMLLLAWHRVFALRESIIRTFSEFDFILAPVSAGTAPKHGTVIYEIDGQRLESQQHFQFASMVNTLGIPAIAFPVKLGKNNLPIGLQLIGPRFSEYSIISALRSAGFSERKRELILA